MAASEADVRVGSMLLKKDFLRGCRATLIQGREQMRKLDSKNYPLGFVHFKS